MKVTMTSDNESLLHLIELAKDLGISCVEHNDDEAIIDAAPIAAAPPADGGNVEARES